jgi:transposase
LICALSSAGPLAPLVIDGSLTGTSFEYYVAHQLCPLLAPNQVVVMDNLSVHHRASIRTLIEARGCQLLFLSPYSPDFNPIELMFSKVKAILRGAARRTVDTLIKGIALALNAVSVADIQHWFKHTHSRLLF